MTDRSTINRHNVWKRWRPDEDPAELERQRDDEAIDEILARAPRMTDEQAARLRDGFRYLPDAEQ